MIERSRVFSLEGRGLKLDTAADLESHIADLHAIDVEEVRLQGNTFGVGACQRLGQVLATKKNLQVANLADIFTGRLLSEIPEALSSLLTSILNLPALHTINLNDNAFGLNTQAPLVAFLASHVPLEHLFLNNNGLGPRAGILVADALSELHAKKEACRKAGDAVPYLQTVVCGRNRLENGSMTAWARAFSLHNKVQEVKMVQNGIRQEGISHLLSQGLNHATDLRILDLQDNTFTLTGAKALAQVVPVWTLLRELGIGDSLLSARGALLLSDALAGGSNKRLETLRLKYNDITSLGIRGLAAAAKSALPALRRIELNGNKFLEDDESIVTLQDLLDERKEAAAPGEGVVDEEWGIDNLSDLEEEDSDEEEEEEEGQEDVTLGERADKLIKEAEEAQEEPVVQVKDDQVDKLAEELEKTGL